MFGRSVFIMINKKLLVSLVFMIYYLSFSVFGNTARGAGRKGCWKGAGDISEVGKSTE